MRAYALSAESSLAARDSNIVKSVVLRGRENGFRELVFEGGTAQGDRLAGTDWDRQPIRRRLGRSLQRSDGCGIN